MDLSSRYEILDTIATGDFATVLRARDRDLGREVAVKQIHQQFLTDQQQLARYWREAQLLASLQHPNILTIYDVVRPRGWLILELMQGSLKERIRGGPLDLDSLRIVLAAGLNALHFLHTNGVIHGDVKPGNLLFDAQNRIKLGDFGLARRASSEEGSLLRGTTKYMAPELVSDQFGTVGPASDLYSLGFSAFELMCGSRFESLFPGLATFGRDQQIAWMMWHAAADRNLPEISRVLEGVPDDLARVIQKLVVKDQARRYQSAQEVLRDLTAGPPVVDRTSQEEDREAAAGAEAARKKRRLRLVAVFATFFSLTLCLAMLFSGNEGKPPRLPRGEITGVFPDDWKMTLASSEDERVREVSFKPHDQFFVNDKPVRLRDLRQGDQVVVKRTRDEALGRWILEVHATRPKIDSGRITSITPPDQDGGSPAVLTVGQPDGQAPELTVSVSPPVEISLNGQAEVSGRPVELGDLQVNDRLVVHHVGQRTGRNAVKLIAQRLIKDVVGTLSRNVRDAKQPLTVVLGDGANQAVAVFPFAEDCQVTINGLPFKAPSDLRQGDKITFDHDSKVVRVRAHRILHHAGRIEKVHADKLEVILEGEGKPIVWLVGPQCKITLFGEPVGLTDLRQGDVLEITHDSLDLSDPKPMQIAAERPPDPTRWAILVGIQDYQDRSLTRLVHPVADATLLHRTLVKRYWVPDSQALLLTDQSLQRLERQISQQLAKVPAEGTLLVYIASHAYRDDQGRVYLAPKDFQLARISTTGLALQTLIDELEKCPAGQKLLLLDCSHAGTGQDLKRQPSTAEMIGTIEGPAGWAPLRTVTAVASCSPGQRGLAWEEKGHGLFAWCLAQGYAGSADQNRDKRIDPGELAAYLRPQMAAFLRPQMAAASPQLQATQTPALVEADNRPPRLAEEARKAVRKLAEHLQRKRIDFDLLGQHYAAAAGCAGAESESKLLYALLLLKGRRPQAAREQFGELEFGHPDWLIPLQGTAWAWFEERGYTAGLKKLQQLASQIAKRETAGEQDAERIAGILRWIGRLRQFAEIAAEKGFRVPPQSLAELDAAVAPPARALYEQGRRDSRDRKQEIENQAESARQAGNLASATQLTTVERYLLNNYAAFPFDEAQKQITDGLDRREPSY